MATHMSIRLAWHNEGWNGHICQKPCENLYCIGQHSYPGDLIAGTRDIEYETAHAGEPCSANPCAVACGLSVNAFGKDTIRVRVDPPDFWKKSDADAIKLICRHIQSAHGAMSRCTTRMWKFMVGSVRSMITRRERRERRNIFLSLNPENL